jgi:CheY-like chemotaxis protein
MEKLKIRKILLVDDDEATNYYNKFVIERLNLVEEIVVKETGKRALDYLLGIEKDDFPNLIFLDINMPEMNGWEFLEAYEKDKLYSRFTSVIVMLTTSINPEDREKASRMKLVNDFKIKPITEKMFLEILEFYHQKLLVTNNL